MNTEEIARLCGSLSLKEKEGPVRRLNMDLMNHGQWRLALCPVGKLLSNRMVNQEAFMFVIKKIWWVHEEDEIEAVVGSIFAFYFKNEDDRKKILEGCPWSFDRCLIVLEEPVGTGDIASMDFGRVDFWLEFQIPFYGILSKVANILLKVKTGYWVACDVANSPSCSGLNGAESWWKTLLRLAIRLKVKLFVWRAYNNWIPTVVNLGRRGLRVSRCQLAAQSVGMGEKQLGMLYGVVRNSKVSEIPCWLITKFGFYADLFRKNEH
ncbi:hypothetical protein Q3G72_025443 [Acer saccharum]|nr:hypothetical protein Q3G72_025443 [Acer saccharum]